MELLLGLFLSLAPAASYAALGIGAALENLIPPIPADTFVLLGGLLAGRGILRPVPLFFVTWSANVLGAMGVYWAGIRLGQPFFQTGLGRRLLNPGHYAALVRFHSRWGTVAILVSRFIPGFRVLVPVFAGVSRMSPVRVAVPVMVASGLWYGVLIWAGYATGANLETLLVAVGRMNQVGLALAGGFLLTLVILWYRLRHPHPDAGPVESSAGPGDSPPPETDA